MVVPSYDEGFDRLFSVCIADNFNLEVKTLPAEEVIHGQSDI
ncbi:hypothetical protein [Microcoleus sp. B4-D4]